MASSDFTVKKGSIAIIMLTIALLSSVATVVAYNVTMKNDIEHLQIELEVIKVESPIQHQEFEERMIECEIINIQNQERILAMHEDIKEMKTDVKELITR